MQGLNPARVYLLLLTVFGIAGLSPLHAAGPRVIENRKFGYRLSVPEEWNVVVPPSGVPVLFNYDKKKALPQGLIPEGGAEVYLIPYEAVRLVAGANRLEDWIQANGRESHTNVRTERVASWTKDESSPQGITRIVADYQRAPEDEELQSEVDYYFTLRGAAFRLRMLFWKGDPRSSDYNSVMVAVLRSIRAPQ